MNTQPQAATAAKPLKGWRVLVPRGGPWGDSVAATLRPLRGTELNTGFTDLDVVSFPGG